ncbi:NfeD family protein [Amaricoccus macauensis]|uniref:NfeD family protein n=1 Tax=Amaricoccus macauensis TaxID=57001 RepID=UPI003C7B5321
MNLPLLGLLTGISPLWWVAIALFLLGLEAVIVSTHLLWPALAAFGVALALWAVPEMSGIGQIGLFAALTIAFVVIGRTIPGRFGRGEDGKPLNRRTEGLIGREAVVETFHWHEGQVNIDGVVWPARLDGRKSPEIGERVKVIAADGIVVWVRRLPLDERVAQVDPPAQQDEQ